jgi:hypothetical protein
LKLGILEMSSSHENAKFMNSQIPMFLNKTHKLSQVFNPMNFQHSETQATGLWTQGLNHPGMAPWFRLGMFRVFNTKRGRD